jgi:glycosyltransferase involved in cell wall biosynthesis/SAM-dependent methyltransferase
MRIAILTTQVPFVTGGAEFHAQRLCDQLRLYGHLAEIVSLPFKWYPPATLLDHMLAATLTDASEYNGVPVDLAIGLKFPAYLANHPNKVIWLLHQYRAAYDEWDSGVGDLLFHSDGRQARDAIRRADDVALRSVRKIFANSQNVASRLKRYNDIDSAPLYHPPPHAERHECRGYEDYLYFPSRLAAPKRQSLALEALAHTRSPVKVVFAGAADNPKEEQALHALAERLGVADRITWRGSISDDEMIDAYARARAVIYPPRDEDYGYVTLEAMLSRKAVITCSDSGGPLEFIVNGLNGLVTAPTAEALATAMDEIWEDADRAERLGQVGWDRYQDLGITWQNVIAQLTSQPVGAPSRAGASIEPRRPSAAEVITRATRPPVDTISERLGIDGIADLGRIYDVNAAFASSSARAYYERHYIRYLASLAMLDLVPGMNILDIGSSAPFVFAALMKRLSPDVHIAAVEEHGSRTPSSLRVTAKADGAWDFEVESVSCDVERQPLPFRDARFDLVLAMEILEHLGLNPAFFAEEIARVTRPGGRVLVTTPNIASHQAVARIMQGSSPYSFGIFQPLYGIHGRHQREWAPDELERLMHAAGFDTERLTTADVYDSAIDKRTADALLAWGRDPALTGETIFYLGTRSLRPFAVPPELYPADPRRYRGRILARRRRGEDADVRISLTNESPLPWLCDGEAPVELEICWLNDDAVLTDERIRLPLPRSLEPGETLDVSVRLGPEARRYEGAAQLRLVHVGHGPFDALDRTNKVLIPLERSSFEAFLAAPRIRED